MADSVKTKESVKFSNVNLDLQPVADLIPTIETRKSVMFSYAVVVKVIIDEKSKLSLKIPITVASKKQLTVVLILSVRHLKLRNMRPI